uniref:Integrin alpha third immunoglobulin-like domain-containing protein n=1 Tax=Varanus komodoensis TaxID=61221 RepID=A0A8D2INU3_VARKO
KPKLCMQKVPVSIPGNLQVRLGKMSVMPTSFFYGPGEESSPVTCMKETINFTFHVSNPGLSLAPAVDLRIQIPNSLAPSETRLFNILEVKSTAGQCQYRNDARDCTLPEKNETIFQDFITYFTKLEKRSLYCMKDDPFCLQILCNLGDMESGKEATVDVTLEATSALVAVVNILISVILEGFHNRKTKTPVTVLFIGISSIIGIILLLLLAYFLWKVCTSILLLGIFFVKQSTSVKKNINKTATVQHLTLLAIINLKFSTFISV